jgi:hypothetical protein
MAKVLGKEVELAHGAAVTLRSASAEPLRRRRYFLGGADLEMRTIRDLLLRHAPGQVVDAGLGWGARASDYRAQIEAALARGERPVLVELAWDLPDALRAQVDLIDHHGARAGVSAPSALRQVFDLLGLPEDAWTAEFALIEANDRGHIAAMRRLGAAPDEIRRIRAADRAAQGVAPADEARAVEAIEARQQHLGGALTVVALPHARTSTVTDRLDAELGGPGFRNLLVLSPAETNFYGDGAWIAALDAAFPGGWRGGELPLRGYWGITSALALDHVLAVVRPLA